MEVSLKQNVSSLKSKDSPLIVQKLGGTSLSSIENIRRAATRAVTEHRSGRRVLVVVSAMAGETNRLLGLAETASSHSLSREWDVIAASGEQISAGLMALAISNLGVSARSFLGHQVPILTDSNFSDANILSINPANLNASLERGEIPVVAGFQGCDSVGNITTLGRGGSDTTAVALAAKLNATVCELYKDVEGVYTTDPHISDKARKLHRLSYPQMLELSSLGSKILHPRSVAIAKEFHVPLQVRSSLKECLGTRIDSEEDEFEGLALAFQCSNKKESTLPHWAKVSLVTSRFVSQLQVEVQMKRILNRVQIPIFNLFSSPLSVSCVIPCQLQYRALTALHDGMELGNSRAPLFSRGV